MDALQAINSLRVVRSYTSQHLSDDELRAIVDTARKTGSSKNTQRWDFITISDRESLRRLGGVTPYAKHLPGAGAAIAQIVAAPNPEHARSVMWDLGRAAQNITLAAQRQRPFWRESWVSSRNATRAVTEWSSRAAGPRGSRASV